MVDYTMIIVLRCTSFHIWICSIISGTRTIIRVRGSRSRCIITATRCIIVDRFFSSFLIRYIFFLGFLIIVEFFIIIFFPVSIV